jgi:diacylglycerol kinase (ATP)
MLPPEEGPRVTSTGRPIKGTLWASFRYAWQGLVYTLQCERNARIHLVTALLVILLSLWLGLSALEWAMITVAIALVFTGEMLNTVIEVLVDMITLEYHPLAKLAKDIAAGAILVASLAAATIGIAILGPRLLDRLGW